MSEEYTEILITAKVRLRKEHAQAIPGLAEELRTAVLRELRNHVQRTAKFMKDNRVVLGISQNIMNYSNPVNVTTVTAEHLPTTIAVNKAKTSLQDIKQELE